MINSIPIVGWLLSVFFSASMAVPFWIVWTQCGIGDTYFFFLPDVWRGPGFFACIGIFISVSIIKAVFVPKLVSVSQSAAKGD